MTKENMQTQAVQNLLTIRFDPIAPGRVLVKLNGALIADVMNIGSIPFDISLPYDLIVHPASKTP